MRAARVRAVPVCDEGRVVGVVTYQDLVRVLARDDKRIAADVRRLLRFYTSPDRFVVRAREGALELVDTMEKAEEWPTVRHLTEQVPGVVTAQVVRPSAATG
jgi:CBS domain-containing protein